MAEPELSPPEQSSLAARIGGTILLAIIGVPFGHEAAHRLLDGDYLSGLLALFIAVSLTVAAIIWVSNASIRRRFGNIAIDPRWWIATLLVLLVYFGASHIQFGKEGQQGLRGEKGEKGDVGPRGLPGATPPQIDQVAIALAQSRWLTDKVATLRQLSKEYCDDTTHYLNYLSGSKILIGNGAAIALNDTTSQIGKIEQTYIESAKDLGQNVIFTLHPNFNENHFRRPSPPQYSIECQDEVWKADQIQDNASREDYVRYYDQYARSKEVMAKVIFGYEAKERDANNIINRIAQESLTH